MLPKDLPFQVSATRSNFPGAAREISTLLNVAVPAVLNQGKQGTPVPALGLWDTGATNTCISETLAKAMGLIPVSQGQTQGVHGIATVNVYLVDIFIPGTPVCFMNHMVSEAQLPNHGLLIGMDIIALGDFSITHNQTETVFSYRIPSLKEPVDYVQEIFDHNAHLANKAKKQGNAVDRFTAMRELKKNKKRK